jgi:hypothetical protein
MPGDQTGLAFSDNLSTQPAAVRQGDRLGGDRALYEGLDAPVLGVIQGGNVLHPIQRAVFYALILDIVGNRKHAAASAYATLNATANLPSIYMTWLVGVGYKHSGRLGLMATDGAAQGVFGITLLLVAMFAGHHWHHRGKPAASTAIA